MVVSAPSPSLGSAPKSTASAVGALFEGRSLRCVPIVGPGVGRAAEQVKVALCHDVEALELRLDLIGGDELDHDELGWLDAIIGTCKAAGVLTVATARSMGAAPYRAAVQRGVDAVDIEIDEGPEVVDAVRRAIGGSAGGGGGVVLIVSHHDFERTPGNAELSTLFDRCVEAGADVVKLVSTATDPRDNFRAVTPLDRGRDSGIPTIAFAMGSMGRASRLLAPARGSAMSYLAISAEASSAPGQQTVSQAEAYLPSPMDAPRVFGIFGNPIGHTLSPAMHGRGFEAARIDAAFIPFLVDDLPGAVEMIRSENLGGVSVTIPFKSEVIPLLDEVDPAASAMGAVNTVVNRDGRLSGYNTDWIGVVGSLESALGGEGTLAGKTAVVLGAGGTARAAAYGLTRAGASVTIANRTAAKAEALAAEFGCQACSLEEISADREADRGNIADILVNTTSVGMHPGPDESPISAEAAAGFAVVLDAVYSPVQTRLLRDAAAAGATTVTGLEMLLHQGFAQFELWTDSEAPRGAMRAAVARAVALAATPAEFTVPGSKSLTQRALICAALAEGRSTLTGALLADDTTHLIGALRQLGARVAIEPHPGPPTTATITVDGVGGKPLPATQTIQLGNNGTATRLLISLCTLGEGSYTLDGSPRLRERPVGPLVDALCDLGADITFLGEEGFLPLTVRGTGLTAGAARFGDLSSSQFVSSVLLASAYADGPVTVHLEGQTVSEPYIAMTASVMERFGVRAHRIDGRTFGVGPAPYMARHFAVEADASSASYGAAVALITQTAVRLPGLLADSDQGDTAFLDVAAAMGGEVVRGPLGATVFGGQLVAGDMVFDMGAIPDTVPTAAVLAALRGGSTTFTNVAHLRVKESDRIAALVTELRRIGCDAEETTDGLTVHGRGGEGLTEASIQTYDDHRIAMAFALVSLRADGIEIEDPSCVAKSFPDFWERLLELRVQIERGGEAGAPAEGAAQNPHTVVLIGHRATGKSTVGAELARRLNLPFFDIDADIVDVEGRTIASIVAADGWDRFREIESTHLAARLVGGPAVIATGGGAVTDSRSRSAIEAACTAGARAVWLQAQPESIARWIEADPNSVANRPPLGGHTSTETVLGETRRLLAERTPLYDALAQVSVETDRVTVEQAATQILARLATTTGGKTCPATR